jgi:hypothetical protein
MEPRKEEENQAVQPRPEETKPKRFRLIKLEERIAPSAGGNTNNCIRTAGFCTLCCHHYSF